MNLFLGVCFLLRYGFVVFVYMVGARCRGSFRYRCVECVLWYFSRRVRTAGVMRYPRRVKIWNSPQDIPAGFGGAVVTIGIYDGVHRGHREVLVHLVREAEKRGLPALVLTFDPHPLTVHRPEADIYLVSTLEDRLNRLQAQGVDIVYVQPYSLEYSQLQASDFITEQLVGLLGARCVVVGEDARFGSGNTGDVQLLREAGQRLGFDVCIVRDKTDDDGKRLSSTRIRQALAEGDVEEAARILGRPHRIGGVVCQGEQRGRDLGFPTANLTGDNLGEVPAHGVYSGWLVRDVPGTRATEYMPAAISIGTNPQFNATQRTVEVHVLGRSDLNLYGEYIQVDFVSRIRPMMKFSSVDELLARMDKDLLATADRLGVPPAGRVPQGAVTAQPQEQISGCNSA